MPSLGEIFLEFPFLFILLLCTEETADMAMPLAFVGTGLSDLFVPIANDIAAKWDMLSYAFTACCARAGFYTPHGDAEFIFFPLF